MTEKAAAHAGSAASASPAQRESTLEHNLFSDLFRISHQLKRTLEPVAPAPSFVDQLRDDLSANVDHARAVLARRQARRRRLKWTAFGVGSMVYVVGLGFVGLRMAQWGIRRLRAFRHPAAPHAPEDAGPPAGTN